MIIAALALASAFPCALGTNWNYEISVLGQKGALSQRVVEVNGPDVILESTGSLGSSRSTSRETWRLPESGEIFKVADRQGAFSPPIPIFKGDAGQWKWSGTVIHDGEQSHANADVSVFPHAKLITPAGGFNAYEISLDLQIGDQTISNRYWYAKGVGWVRIEAYLPGGTVSLSLAKLAKS